MFNSTRSTADHIGMPITTDPRSPVTELLCNRTISAQKVLVNKIIEVNCIQTGLEYPFKGDISSQAVTCLNISVTASVILYKRQFVYRNKNNKQSTRDNLSSMRQLVHFWLEQNLNTFVGEPR